VNAGQTDADTRPGWRIAIVDDDPGVRRSLTRLLRATGFDVLAFESAEAFLNGTPPSLRCLVLDVQLGGQTGLDLYEQLTARGRVIPVVFITSHEEYLGAPLPSDRRALLRKPFEAPDLIGAIRRVVSAAEAEG
jgi:FixJ family two-component response regulator